MLMATMQSIHTLLQNLKHVFSSVHENRRKKCYILDIKVKLKVQLIFIVIKVSFIS